MTDDTDWTSAVEIAIEPKIAWLGNANTTATQQHVSTFIKVIHEAVIGLVAGGFKEAAAAADYIPAVSVRRLLSSRDHIISLIDGKPHKTLRRHLSRHGLSPEQYRERYGLKPDYPIVAEAYSQVRRDLAKRIGLGRKLGARVATKVVEAAPKPRAKPRGRPRKAQFRHPATCSVGLCVERLPVLRSVIAPRRGRGIGPL